MAFTQDHMIADADGVAAVRGGKIIIIDPIGTGRRPVLIPTAAVGLKIDGTPVTEPAQVTADMAVLVHPTEPRRAWERAWEVELSADGLTVWLQLGAVNPGVWELPDQGPAQTLPLVAVWRPCLLPQVRLEDVLKGLAEAGVTFGIDQQSIMKALSSTGETRVIVARGLPAEQGRPGALRPCYPTLQEADVEKAAYTARCDANQVLAEIDEPAPGAVGKDCLGRPLRPERTRPVDVVVGPGAILCHGGRQVRAKHPGRPVIHHLDGDRWWIGVVPVRVLATGRFPIGATVTEEKGDLEIRGNVDGPVAISAAGAVWVRGHLAGSRIEAGEAVLVDGQVMQSILTTRQAGGSGREPLLRAAVQVQENVEAIAVAVKQVVNHAAYVQSSRQVTVSQVF
ncbi:MAG TPA: flagellar assembly protein A, partial [Symbiobacteriaceae bacterium]|nr:flagellar assembly protein A [Symbiobacteriaceae bacterium]